MRALTLGFWLLLATLAGAQPRFLPDPALPAAPTWQPARDSLDDRLYELCGTWQWSTAEGQSGSCRVPSCWTGMQGEICFSRNFRLPDTGIQQVYRLWFGGVASSCRVHLNGKFLDRHEGSSASFELEIPERFLHFGDTNQLEVWVDNRLSARQTIPLKTQSGDPQNFGGIYREVFLLQGPRLRLEEPRWHLARVAGGDALDLTVGIRNQELLGVSGENPQKDAELWLEAVLRRPDGSVLASARQPQSVGQLQTSEAHFVLTGVSPLPRWSPDRPELLELVLSLGQGAQVLHRRRLSVGLKEVTTQGGRFFVNGTPLFLQGLTYVSDHPRSGIALSPSVLTRDLETMKNMGVNLVLNVRGAAHPLMAELCDRLGMLLLSELPVWQVPPRLLAHESFHQASLNHARDLLRQDRGHASWLGLSLGSGLDVADPAVLDWIKSMQALRKVSPLLLGAGGFLAHADQGSAGVPGLDFLLLEPFGTRDHGEPPQLGIPILLSRIGWQVEIGNLEGYENPYGELHQAYRIQTAVALAQSGWRESSGGPAGTIIHSFADWRGGSPQLGSPPGQRADLVTLGVHSEDRVARSAAKDLANLYSGSAPSTLSRGEYRPQHPPAYPLAGFVLLILLLIGCKQNNVLWQNLKRSFIHSHGFFTDIRDKRIYQFGQAVFLLILVSGTLALLGSAWLHLMRKSPFFDRLLGLVVVLDPLQHWISRLAWSPLESMTQLALAFLGGQILFAIGLRLLGLLSNARFSFQQAITLMAWTATSLLFAIPIGIVFHPLIQSAARIPTIVLLMLLALWYLARLFKALRIAFEGRFWGMFSLMTILGLVVLVLVLVWYERSQSLFEYLDYYRRIYGGA